MTDSTPNSAPLMLSVSGARGIVGASMTEDVARRLAAIWGSHLAASTTGSPRVVLGRDSRPSGSMLAEAAAEGLVGAGCEVVRLGIVTTPTAGVMIGAMRATGGIMITASHNPTPWNGLKLLDGNGTAPPASTASEIIERFKSDDPIPSSDVTPAVLSETRGHDTHVAKVLGQIDPVPIRSCAFKVVLDSVNGAGGPAGSQLLGHLGCQLHHVNAETDGLFAHPPEPKEENLLELCEVVKTTGAVVGFAQDPDADRLAIVDELGRYIGEEYTLALAARSWLALNPGSPVVANLSTSRLIDDVAAQFGSVVHRSPVGEANVAQVMRSNDAMFGGEGNGGVMLPAVTWIRDSLTAMSLVLQLMARESRALSAIVDDMPRYAMIKQTIMLEGSDAARKLDESMASLESHYTAQSDARVSTVDGVRIDLPSGWMHLRPSNTEPIARLIVESDTEASAQALAGEARRAAGL